jgi:hypothetical protein
VSQINLNKLLEMIEEVIDDRLLNKRNQESKNKGNKIKKSKLPKN